MCEHIQKIKMENIERYGEIYAEAFSGELMDAMLNEIKKRGMVDVHLITAGEGVLPAFYEKYGFKKENEVILMVRGVR